MTNTEITTRQKKLLITKAFKAGWVVFNNVNEDSERTYIFKQHDFSGKEYYMNWTEVSDFLNSKTK